MHDPVTAIDPNNPERAEEEEETSVNPMSNPFSTAEERLAYQREQAAGSMDTTLREQLRQRLPESWSEEEVNQFFLTYYERIPEQTEEASVESVEEEEEQVVVETNTLPISRLSRKGYTLDTHVIIDGRSVPLRALHEAGLLYPGKVIVTEGTQRFPRRAVQYAVRVIDRPLIYVITEETYRTLSKAYPQQVPHDEPLSAEGIKRVQATTTVLTADTMERVLPDV